MSAEIEADDNDVVAALEGEQATPLPRAFIAEASGPATVVRDRGEVTERAEVDLEITHRIETLEEFGEFWALRNKRFPENEAIGTLLEVEPDGARYVIGDDQLDAWDVQVDGHVQAFFGVGEAIVEFDGDLESFDAPNQRFWSRVANNIGHDVDDLVADFARDLKSTSLWGPGAHLAELAVKHGSREGLESYTEALLEEVSE
ncbi:hypothetical protein [Natrarchaeobius oligotrophus]|uniref:Uncharacterized protein n=1 Tax=Natrarchaeobius chitinivorans TaxID=1679083 RepID=A0A3N6PB30_NATCH|nr:hypothetical protein [Natrarchaeobius chitinivorans]RQG93705.1 hypothetical protein EA472_22475 [Natrarchaeobius chitinivorans]